MDPKKQLTYTPMKQKVTILGGPDGHPAYADDARPGESARHYRERKEREAKQAEYGSADDLPVEAPPRDRRAR